MLPEAKVFDLDNTLIKRTPLEKSIIFLKQRKSPHKLPIYTREEIARLDINHLPIEQPSAGLSEYLSLQLIAKSKLFPGIADEIKRLADQGLDIFANTGRPNKSIWADITKETLEKEGVIDYFKEIFYTPQNTDVAVSKAHTLHLISERYNILEFSDDDARVAHYTALTFPDLNLLSISSSE